MPSPCAASQAGRRLNWPTWGSERYARGRYWPEPLIQINPNYKRSGTVQELVAQGSLHPACAELFKTGKVEGKPANLHLYVHQLQAIAKAHQRQSYVVTTGTGSGKSLSFFIPVIDRILKAKQAEPTPRTRAIVIYPMNALANSQLEELDKFLHGYSSSTREARSAAAMREKLRENALYSSTSRLRKSKTSFTCGLSPDA